MTSSTTQSLPPAPNEPPTEQHRRRLDLSGKQVGASAGAAVTSALGASFFGATGTIAGAAVGSVISTIAGAVYSRSIEGAQTKLRETTVVVRKVPPRSSGPSAVPGDLPEVARGAERQAGADATQAIDAPATQAVEVPGTTAIPAVTEPGEAPPRLSNRKRLLVLGAIMLSGFVLAMGGITLAEKLIGHPVSGGSDGTSFGTVTGGSGSTSDEQPAEPQPSVTPSEGASAEPEPTASAEPSATSSPEASATPEPTATAEPSASEPEPTAEPSQAAGAGAAPAPTAASGD